MVTVGSQCGTWVICALGGALVLVGPSVTPEIGVAWPAHRGGGAVLHTEGFVTRSSDSCCRGNLGDGAIGVLEIVPMLVGGGIGGLEIAPMFVGWTIGVLVLAPGPAIDCDCVVVGVGASVSGTIPLDGGNPSERAGGFFKYFNLLSIIVSNIIRTSALSHSMSSRLLSIIVSNIIRTSALSHSMSTSLLSIIVSNIIRTSALSHSMSTSLLSIIVVLVVVGAGVCITRPVDGGRPSGRAGGVADNESVRAGGATDNGSVRAPWCCPSPARLGIVIVGGQ